MEKYLAVIAFALGIGTATFVVAEEKEFEFPSEPFSITMSHICDDTDKMFDRLEKDFGERPIIVSKEGKEAVTVWMSDSGTISIVRSHLELDKSCLMESSSNAQYLNRSNI